MKVSFPHREDATSGAGQGAKPRLGKILAGVLLGAVVLLFAVVLWQPEAALRKIAEIERGWAGGVYSHDPNGAGAWSIAIGSFFRSQIADLPEVNELIIDVPFRDIRRIYRQREEALATGHLVQGPDDFVDGSIRLGARTVPVKLRLKGDWVDHLQGRKWSFRVRVRNGDHLLGMRRFSLQNPFTRGFQAELMYFELLRGLGVMTPRYEFVDVTLNGDSVGLMALEEFFARELLEFHRRREGVIVRFDESLPWEARDSLSGEPVGWNGAFDDYRSAAIDSIGSTRVAESPVLSEQYRVAEGLLRGFADGKLPASDVFDAEQLGRFIAASDVLGAWHATRWANLRFYLNPVSLKLEPIPFDATLQEAFTDARSIVNSEPVLLDMLSDPAVWRVYLETLGLLKQLAEAGTLQANLQGVEDQWLALLQTEFRMLGAYSLDYAAARAATLYTGMSQLNAERNAELSYYQPFEPGLYPVLAHFAIQRDTGNPVLQIENAIPKDVTVDAVDWVNDASGERRPAASENVPLGVPPRGIGSPGRRLHITLDSPPESDGWVLETKSRIAGRTWASTTRPKTAQAGFTASPLPRADAQSQLRKHDFLSLDGTVMHVTAGDWQVNQHLVVPAGYSLHAPAGTKLRFAPNAALIAHGPVQFHGTTDDPVMLLAARETWPGFVVMNAGTRCTLEHVIVGSTHSVEIPGWTLTGGANFYRSDVTIRSSRFMNSRGEDALNLIESEFRIDDSEFTHTASDAIDADFSRGTITNSRFVRIGGAGGGDAIDVSGSTVDVRGLVFERVSDKSLSIGERSEMTATNIRISDAGTGAASKDASVLRISDSRIANAGFAAMTAYIKKPEYGPASLFASNVVVEDTDTPAIVQTGSVLTLDGDAVAAQDIDVDALYETVMRPGLRE